MILLGLLKLQKKNRRIQGKIVVIQEIEATTGGTIGGIGEMTEDMIEEMTLEGMTGEAETGEVETEDLIVAMIVVMIVVIRGEMITGEMIGSLAWIEGMKSGS